MNLQVSYDEEAKNKATNSPLNNENLTQIPTRLLNEISQDKRLEPLLRQLLEAAISAARKAERRVIEWEIGIDRLRQLSVIDAVLPKP